MPNMKKPAPKKPAVKTVVKKTTPMPKVGPKPKPLTGPAAVAELQRQVSPNGVKKAAEAAKKATDKKYPGLYKSTASKTQSKASATKLKVTNKTPLETKRVGGIIAIPVKPKKTIY